MDQTIPIVLTQQELEALVQQQQQLQDINSHPEAAEPEAQHTSMPTGGLPTLWNVSGNFQTFTDE